MKILSRVTLTLTFWQTIVVFHKFGQGLRVDGFVHHLNHSNLVALLQGPIIDKSCHSRDNSRNCVVLSIIIALLSHLFVDVSLLIRHDLLRCLEAVNLRHVEVHKDQLELDLAALLAPVSDEQVNCLLAPSSSL